MLEEAPKHGFNHILLDVGDGIEYIHLGMDEEDINMAKNREYAVCRHGELYWHDLFQPPLCPYDPKGSALMQRFNDIEKARADDVIRKPKPKRR